MGALATAQWIAIFSVVISVTLLLWRHTGWSAEANPEDTLHKLSVHPYVPQRAKAGARR